MTEPLKYEIDRIGDKAIYLYECEHLTRGTAYATDGFVLNLGEHANLLLCKHCKAHMFGMVNSEQFRLTVVRMGATSEQMDAAIAALTGKPTQEIDHSELYRNFAGLD